MLLSWPWVGSRGGLALCFHKFLKGFLWGLAGRVEVSLGDNRSGWTGALLLSSVEFDCASLAQV